MTPEMEIFLNLLTNNVSRNIQVISNTELGQDFMLHVSPDKMSNKSYIPRIGHRQADSEDRTVPRITAAPTLLGCYVGYAQWFYQFLGYDPQYSDKYKQGLYIHEIEFDEALKPTSKLVGDQQQSDEHWLVTYNDSTKEYKGRIIGKMFISEIRVKSISGKVNQCSATFIIEVNKEKGIRFSKNIFLEKGYWVIEGVGNNLMTSWDNDTDLSTKEISKTEYISLKNQSAAMLSLNITKPPFTKW